MDFNLFVYCTLGRREELEAGGAGLRNDLYQRMLAELGEFVETADDAGYAGFGHPEHHLQIEGFEASNEPTLTGMFIGQHSKRLRVITCGFVSTTHNPLRTAESIATMDHMLGGRFGVGLVRGYQARWVSNYRVREDLEPVGPWNRDTEADAINREYFTEFVEVVLKALRNETFSHRGKYWNFPPLGYVNPHDAPAYTRFGRGVEADMSIREVGIAPRPLQTPHPPLYAGFTHSLRTAVFWAKYLGKPIVLAENLDFCERLWAAYRSEAEKFGHDVTPGEEAAWGGAMICAPTDAEAQALADDYKWFWDAWFVPFGQGHPEYLVGSPDTLSKRIEEASGRVPFRECFLLIPQGLHTRDQVMRSIELFGEKVIPRFS
jgi:alkanesulfonate monooxygenase SsuD/methylene tetrahydromethanopterin reductase-like flavin-dependent oxidoreductase (luciferase family)